MGEIKLCSLETSISETNGLAEKDHEEKLGPDMNRRHSRWVKCREILKQNLVLILTLIGVIIGICLGIVLRYMDASSIFIAWIGLPGTLVMRSLKMCIIPLIVSNLIAVMGKTSPKTYGLAGLYTLVYAVITNLVATFSGLVFVILLKPGYNMVDKSKKDSLSSGGLTTADVFYDLLINMVPQNLIEACLFQSVTVKKDIEKIIFLSMNSTNATLLSENGKNYSVITHTVRSQSLTDGTNILGIVIGSIIFGLAAGKAKTNGAFVSFFEELSSVIHIILNWIVCILPLGVASLLAASIASVADLESILDSMGRFMAATLMAVLSMQLVILPLIFLVLLKRNPIPVFMRLYKAWVTAFVTMSTATSIPYIYEACDKLKIDLRISRFVVPIAMSMNSNGSAAFICIATVFIAQYNGIALGIGTMVLIASLAAMSVLALPAVPSGSIVAVVILMGFAGVPAESVSLLFTTEFILDRFRTTTNVVSHIFCCSIVEKFSNNNQGRVEDIVQTQL